MQVLITGSTMALGPILYPNAIDGYSQLPAYTDRVTAINADRLNNIRNAIAAIETELGVLPKGDFASVRARLDAIEAASPAGLQDQIDAINAELTDIENQLVAFTGATAFVNGEIGLVPEPVAGDHVKYLKGDGTWASVPTLADGDKGDITVSSSGSVWTIDNDQVTFAKIQNITSSRMLGRTTGGSGDIEEISVGAPLTLSASTLDFDESAAIGNNARVAIKKAGTTIGTRRGVNFIEGSGVTLTVTDDVGNEEVDVEISTAGDPALYQPYTVVFNPNATPGTNVYSTWATAYAAALTYAGLGIVTILIDNVGGSDEAIEINPGGPVTYDLDGIILRGATRAFIGATFSTASYVETSQVVTIKVGANVTIANAMKIEDLTIIMSEGTDAMFVYDLADANGALADSGDGVYYPSAMDTYLSTSGYYITGVHFTNVTFSPFGNGDDLLIEQPVITVSNTGSAINKGIAFYLNNSSITKINTSENPHLILRLVNCSSVRACYGGDITQSRQILLDTSSFFAYGPTDVWLGASAETMIDLPFTGASTFVNGKPGIVPMPSAGDEYQFLRGDGGWDFPIPDGNYGDITVSTVATPADTWEINNDAIDTGKILDEAVTLAKLQDINQSRLLGRGNTFVGPNPVEEISLSSSLKFAGTVLSTEISGDVSVDNSTGLASIGASVITSTMIQNDAVTLAKIEDIPNQSLIGRWSGGPASPESVYVGNGLEWSSSIVQRSALTGDVTASAGSNSTTIANSAVTTAKINDAAVTFAKIQDVASGVLLGRYSALTGDVEALTPGGGLAISGSTLVREALTGDVTATFGSNTTTIANNAVTTTKIIDDAVTYAKIQNMTNLTILGNASGGAASPVELQALNGLEFPSNAGIGIANQAITFARMQNISTDTLIGRDSPGSGSPREISILGGIEFTGGNQLQRSALTGDVTATAGSNTTIIAAGVVDFSKIRTIDTQRLLGRTTATTGVVEQLTVTAPLLLTSGSGTLSILAPVTTVYSAGSGNYTIPSTGATRLRIEIVGAGGGGASGARYATATVRQGGNGGGGGGGLCIDLPISFFGSPGDTIAYAVGSGGGGGAAVTVNSTAGTSGTAGGDTTFGSFTARGGAGGTCTGSGTSVLFPPVITRGGNGGGDGGIGGTTAGNGVPGQGGSLGGGGGGCGGSIGSGNVASAGQNGGPGGSGAAGGVGGNTTPTAGTAGTSSPSNIPLGGGGGGGGGAIATGAASADGAAGGNPGGGGGGGGGSINGQNSGAGAAGGNGLIAITAY
jgi:hypothetical protein